ncbi:anti-sigma factor domain-containing protein [Streptomyces seoulensis]
MGVIASAREGRAALTLSGRPAPPRGSAPRLRAVRPGAPPRSPGLLAGFSRIRRGHSAGDPPPAVAGHANSAASLAVTVEP